MLPLPVEFVQDLSHSDFVEKYVNTGKPVILRRRNRLYKERSSKIDSNWLLNNCNTKEGLIHSFKSKAGSKDWGGFDFSISKEVPLDNFLQSDQGNYGFDYKVACFCPRLLDKIPMLQYFQGDVLRLLAQGDVNWPVLIAGKEGTFSGLHVDSFFLPFWLTLINGEKEFRVISLQDWKQYLTGSLYTKEGSINNSYNEFDDIQVKEKVLSKGADMYVGKMQTGDSIYIPVGALHGAVNTAKGMNFALTSNFLDKTHRDQINEHYCSKFGGSLCATIQQKETLSLLDSLDEDRRNSLAEDVEGSEKEYYYWQFSLSK